MTKQSNETARPSDFRAAPIGGLRRPQPSSVRPWRAAEERKESELGARATIREARRGLYSLGASDTAPGPGCRSGSRGEKVASNINSPPGKPKTSVATPDLPILRVHEVVHGIEKQSNAD